MWISSENDDWNITKEILIASRLSEPKMTQSVRKLRYLRKYEITQRNLHFNDHHPLRDSIQSVIAQTVSKSHRSHQKNPLNSKRIKSERENGALAARSYVETNNFTGKEHPQRGLNRRRNANKRRERRGEGSGRAAGKNVLSRQAGSFAPLKPASSPIPRNEVSAKKMDLRREFFPDYFPGSGALLFLPFA